MDRQEVLRSLGDGTRFGVYSAVAASESSRSTAEVAEALGLHPNTVRPHLEHLREVGLLEIDAASRGAVGRPQHRYVLSAGAPVPSAEPPAYAALSEIMVSLAGDLGATGPDAVEAGRRYAGGGREVPRDGWGCVASLLAELDDLDFDPSWAAEGRTVTVSFGRCPFRAVAEAHPELVCRMHEGIVDGLVERSGGASVESFCTLSDPHPCQAVLAIG